MLSKADKCRAAISAGNYEEADGLLADLRTEVEAAWPAASADERQTISAQVLDLLKWARHTTLVRRSHAQRRLSQITRSGAYLATNPSNNGNVEIEG